MKMLSFNEPTKPMSNSKESLVTILTSTIKINTCALLRCQNMWVIGDESVAHFSLSALSVEYSVRS